MAQILVKNRPTTGGELDYTLDDPIAIAEDGFTGWGARELDTARFRIVTLPGNRADYLELLDPEPATVRDIYPRSLLRIRRLRLRLSVETKKSDSPRAYRRQRLRTMAGDTPAIKRIPAR